MDYKQELFYRASEQDMSKMPFYMAYPMQTVYMEELEYEQDMQKLKNMYPKEVRAIQAMVEEECDKMEYDGSLMFDEYPDKLMLSQIVKRIYNNMSVSKTDIQEFQPGAYEAEQYEEGQYPPSGSMPPSPSSYEGSLQAEELPLEGKLISQSPPRRPGGPSWGPGGSGGPGWGPGPGSSGPGGPGWGPGPGPSGPPHYHPLRNMIEVLLYNEMYQRRCRHKRCRRWW